MITATLLTKRYRNIAAVESLTFRIEPGRVTGLVGPNGAGKSTTMRMVVGLERPSSGTVTVDGQRYQDLDCPLRTIGVLLDADALDPRRRALDHLRWLARSNDIPRSRIDLVLDLVGLTARADRPVAEFSLGMRQRLGLAGALLGDPATVLLDEPINGLDPDGIVWLRSFLRTLADEGRTVVVSSHLMDEMARTADHLLVIGAGHLLADAPTQEIVRRYSRPSVVVRAPRDQPALDRLIVEAGGNLTLRDDRATVVGLTAERIGAIAADHGIGLAELTPVTPSLETAFLELTHARTSFRAGERLDPIGADR